MEIPQVLAPNVFPMDKSLTSCSSPAHIPREEGGPVPPFPRGMDTPGTQLKDGYRCVLSRGDVLGEGAIPFLLFFCSRNRGIPCLSSLLFFRKPLLAAVVGCWAL